jgi:CBS domain-containing protein
MKTSASIANLLHYKTTPLWSVTPNTTVFDAIKMMADKNIGAVLVMSGDILAGIFSERDYTRKVVLHGKTSRDTHVWEIMNDQITTVTPEDSVEDCMRLMTDKRLRHLPVLNGSHVVGLVSIGDLVNWTISAQDAAISQMEQYIAGGVSV